jgi:hypothetical protein
MFRPKMAIITCLQFHCDKEMFVYYYYYYYYYYLFHETRFVEIYTCITMQQIPVTI